MVEIKQMSSGVNGRKTEADLLKRSVEGNESPMSYELHDGQPVMSARGVALNAPVNLRLLTDFL
jgi:hypothetical protein